MTYNDKKKILAKYFPAPNSMLEIIHCHPDCLCLWLTSF